jgi:hypothetical protein
LTYGTKIRGARYCMSGILQPLVLVALILLAVTPSASVAEKKYSCPSGMVPASGNRCMPAGNTDCGGGKTCKPGSYCAGDGKGCVPNGGTYCGKGHSCEAGHYCAADGDGYGCVPNGATACSGGYYCEAGATCAGDGRCLRSAGADKAPACGPGYHLFFPGGGRVECQINQPGDRSGSGPGPNQSTITGTGQR